jgi:hypothetical protein
VLIEGLTGTRSAILVGSAQHGGADGRKPELRDDGGEDTVEQGSWEQRRPQVQADGGGQGYRPDGRANDAQPGGITLQRMDSPISSNVAPMNSAIATRDGP